MKIKYIERKFQQSSLDVIEVANKIIREYRAQGFKLTLRQLYYQFVARALVPNTERSYKRIGKIVNDGRLAGLIDWSDMEDRTRWLREQSHWDSPSEIIAACADQFLVDMWEDQKRRVEVWIEKDALVGVIEGVCEEFDVPFFACRGYVSQSEQWVAGQRARRNGQYGQRTLILHFGDHDPSGIDMTRDIEDRLNMFAPGTTEVRRMALNMSQVEEYGPPPNPAKMSDSRAEGYVMEYGYESWELDALEPSVMADIIAEEVQKEIDDDLWASNKERQAQGRRDLRHAADKMREAEGEDEGDI